MIEEYSDNCDYIRKKFELADNVSIYQLVNKAVDFIKEVDNKIELEKQSQKENVECQKKKVLKSKSKKKSSKKK